MKYLKKFENENNQPKSGDWVYMKIDPNDFDWVKNSKKLIDFFTTNIGRVRYFNSYNDKFLIEFFPKNKEEERILNKYWKENGYDDRDPKYSFDFYLEEIEYYSSNKDDIEVYIQAKKYNL